MEYSFYENDGITPSKIADALQRIFLWTIPVIICVGTDAAIGDTLGPLVGTKLKEAKIPAYVYGNLGKTITAKEIGAIKTFIANVHPLARTLVVDAAVGRCEDVGKIKVFPNGIYPGLGADKRLPEIGDGAIIGIVSKHSQKNDVFMNFTRLSPVYKMAETVYKGIFDYVTECNKKPAYKSENGVFSALPLC